MWEIWIFWRRHKGAKATITYFSLLILQLKCSCWPSAVHISASMWAPLASLPAFFRFTIHCNIFFVQWKNITDLWMLISVDWGISNCLNCTVMAASSHPQNTRTEPAVYFMPALYSGRLTEGCQLDCPNFSSWSTVYGHLNERLPEQSITNERLL